MSIGRRIHSFCSGWDRRRKRQRPGMGRMPSPLQNVAVVYPFLQETPLGRVTELLGDEGYKRSMPRGRTECKRKLNRVKPQCQVSRVPAIGNASRLHTVFLFGTIAQEMRT